MSDSTERTKWGRVKFGSGRLAAMSVAIPSGLLAGVALGVACVWSGLAAPVSLLGVAALAVCLAMPVVMLVWVLVVDRSTLQGAAERSEESIEARWYARAAAGAQTDVIFVAAVSALVLTLVPGGEEIDARLALLGVVAASFLSFSLRYQVLRRKG